MMSQIKIATFDATPPSWLPRLSSSAMHVRVLGDADVERLLDLDALLEALARGFSALSDGRVAAPPRHGVDVTSPDGRWLAFQSNASGRDEIFVRPFPNVDAGNWTISPSGGTRPLWARNGTELFYLDSAGAMTHVPVQTAPTFSAGTATTLFETRYFSGALARTYDVSSDGQRFLMIKSAAAEQAPPMVVVLHWLEELKAKLPAK